MSTLFLRNIEQVALFRFELAGQLSDGHWENSRPHDHWEVWCRCDVEVAPAGTAPGRNFFAKRSTYGLTSSELLSVVGGRMLGQVRLTQAFGLDAAEELESFLGCDSDFEVSAIEIPKHAGDYWDKKRAAIAKFDLTVINTQLVHGNYGKKKLLQDLREIKDAMRNSVYTKDIPKGVANSPSTSNGLVIG